MCTVNLMNEVNIVSAVSNTEILPFQYTAVSAVHNVWKHEAWTTTKVSLFFNLELILTFQVKLCFGLFKLLHSCELYSFTYAAICVKEHDV